MSVTEAQRLHLFKSIEEWLPDEDLATLMSMLPPAGWGDVATKRDLDEHRAATKLDLDALKHDLEGQITSVRHEIASTATTLRAEFRADLAEELNRQTNRYITWMLASNAAFLTASAIIAGLT